ncbi:response regulator [bacterium]|nr:response regulator [bacterium]
MPAPPGRILIIDDDLNILHGYRRMLGRRYEVEIAEGPREGLQKALSGQQYAVIICDLHMPKIDGLSLMAKVRELSPHTVRIILTGSLDNSNALNAMNDGTIFRYLTKPCRLEVLSRCIDEGLTFHRQALLAERMRGQTLVGLALLMADLFSVQEPQLAGSAPRIHALVSQMTRRLALPDAWEFEVAAALCKIGLVSLPPALKTCLSQGLELSSAQAELVAQSPQRAASYLEPLTDLEEVARMLAGAGKPLPPVAGTCMLAAPRWLVGAQLLRLANDYEQQRAVQPNALAAVQVLRQKAGDYFPEMLECLVGLVTEECKSKTTLSLDKLRPGMVLAEDLVSHRGQMLIARGQTITPATLGFLGHRREFGFDLPGIASIQTESIPTRASAGAA